MNKVIRMRHARWYFDFVSPYAYIAQALLERVPGSVRVVPTPVLFAALLDHWGTVGPAELPPKRLHTYRHAAWLARRHGLPFRMPDAHPFNPLRALRLAIAAGAGMEAVHRIFDAIWARGLDLADRDSFARLGHELGVDDAEFAITTPEVKAELHENTKAAIAAGVFGVPSVVMDRQVFWGVDAFPMFLDYLCDAKLFEGAEMARYPTLPVGATRTNPGRVRVVLRSG